MTDSVTTRWIYKLLQNERILKICLEKQPSFLLTYSEVAGMTCHPYAWQWRSQTQN